MNSQFYYPKTPFSQSYLLSRIVRHAKRSQKIPVFIRENGLNSVRWTEPVSVILQISLAVSLGLGSMLSAMCTDPAQRSDQQSDQLCNKFLFSFPEEIMKVS